MSKVYDATREFKPFDRSQAAPKRHPNKGRKAKAAPVVEPSE